jgi:hypothetical protein
MSNKPSNKPSDAETDDLRNRFSYHKPNADQLAAIGMMREKCLRLAEFVVADCPPGRERSLALTHLEQVMFWANAAVAREGEVKT